MGEQSVSKGFAVLSAAGIIVKLLSLLYIPFLIAIVGEEGNGIYAAANQVYVLLYAITNVGLPVAISKLVSELIAVGNYKDAVRSFKIARFLLIIMGVLAAALMAIFAKKISIMMHYEKSYLAILFLSPAFLFTAVSSAYRGYFQGRGNMIPTAVSQILEQVINAVFTLVFASILIKKGLEWGCAGGMIGTALAALIAAIFLVRFHDSKGRMSENKNFISMDARRYTYSELLKKVVGYSIPITLSIGMQYAGNLIDVWNTKVRLMHGGYSESMATELFSHLYKYQQLLNAPIAVMAALAATILPAISAAVALRDKTKVKDRVNYAYRLCFLITIPSALGFSVLSDPIYRMLKYGQGSNLMLYGSVALVMLAIVQIQTSILQGAGKLYLVTFNLVLGIIGKIVTNYFMVSIHAVNIYGAIIGSIVGYIISISLNSIVIRKTLKVKTRLLRHAFKPVIAAIAMAAAAYGSYFLITALLGHHYLIVTVSTLLSITIGAAAYFACVVLIGGMVKEDLEILPARLHRFIPSSLMKRIH